MQACAAGGDWLAERRASALARAREFSWERTARLTREVYLEARRRHV
jgi:glycosyltransferase involved in cell wall biosynthesis